MSDESNFTGQVSEQTFYLVADAWISWHSGNHEACISKLETLLGNSADLSPIDVRYITFHLRIRQRALDPHYVLPQHYNDEDTYPLMLKAIILRETGDYVGCLALEWTYLQHCAVGTSNFLDAASALADTAVKVNELELLRHSLALFLAGWHFRYYTNKDVFTEQHDFCLSAIPIDAALAGMAMGSDPVYVQVLELALSVIPEEDNRNKAVKAVLDKYYSGRAA